MRQTKTKANIIVQGGVHFMAETSKILNPDKVVLIPDSRAGCSLASSITGEDVRAVARAFPRRAGRDLRQHLGRREGGERHLLHVVQRGADRREHGLRHRHHAAGRIPGEICGEQDQGEDHRLEGLTARCTSASPADELRRYRADDPGIQIIAHPECPPDVLAEADFTGSTAHMIDWVKQKHPRKVVMVTECSMAANVKVEMPDVEFVQPCNLCPHMKRITLPKILDCAA